jgi:hypothetical protein
MSKIRDLNSLKARRRDAIELAIREMLQGVWQGVEYRLDICRVTNGAHVGTS